MAAPGPGIYFCAPIFLAIDVAVSKPSIIIFLCSAEGRFGPPFLCRHFPANPRSFLNLLVRDGQGGPSVVLPVIIEAVFFTRQPRVNVLGSATVRNVAGYITKSAGLFARRALIGQSVGFQYITAIRTFPLSHWSFPPGVKNGAGCLFFLSFVA